MKPIIASLRTAAVAALVCCALASQQTWLVRCGSNGPSVHFSDLPQAVAAAAPGDTIRVIYDSGLLCGTGTFRYSPTVIDKPLTIVGVLGSGVGWIDECFVRGVLEIRDIAAGERVVVRGLRLWGDFLSPADRGIEAVNCDGQIVLDRVFVRGQGLGGAVARFTDCDDVVIHNSEFVMAQRPMEVVRSNVRLTNCLVRPDGLLNGWPQAYFNTSPGISVDDGKVTLETSSVSGAANLGLPGMISQPGVYLDHGVLEIGPDSGVFGGEQFVPSYLMAGSGMETVYRDPRSYVSLVPSGVNNSPPIARDMHTTMYNKAAPGTSFDYGIAGPPNGFAVLVFGAYGTSALPSPLGDVWLHPQALSVIGLHPLDFEGYHWGALPVPPGVGSPFVYGLQSLLVSPTGHLEVSRATPFVLGWQANLSPY